MATWRTFYEVRRLQITPGTRIEAACEAAVDFATANDCYVEFEFNGFGMTCSSTCDPDAMVERFHIESRKPVTKGQQHPAPIRRWI